MSLKQLIVGVLMAVCTIVTYAPAQKNELSGLVGRTSSAIKVLGEALSSTTYISATALPSK